MSASVTDVKKIQTNPQRKNTHRLRNDPMEIRITLKHKHEIKLKKQIIIEKRLKSLTQKRCPGS